MISTPNSVKSKPLKMRNEVKMKRKKSEKEKNKENEGFINNWEEKQEEAFELLKEKLITTPILIYLDFNKEFILYTDVLTIALGAILYQKGDDGLEHVVAYENKTLNRAKKNYSVTELECLAVVKDVSCN